MHVHLCDLSSLGSSFVLKAKAISVVLCSSDIYIVIINSHFEMMIINLWNVLRKI